MCITCENYVYRVYKYTQYLHSLLVTKYSGGGEVVVIQSLYPAHSHHYTHSIYSIFSLFISKNVSYSLYPHSLLLLLLRNVYKYDKIENI